MTETEFNLKRAKTITIRNFLKFLICLAIASVAGVYTVDLWGAYYVALPLVFFLYFTVWFVILMFKVQKNIRDVAVLSEINEYANSLEVQGMDGKEDE
jgi:energy-coupling factor transporter transmembrane protein EcfT